MAAAATSVAKTWRAKRVRMRADGWTAAVAGGLQRAIFKSPLGHRRLSV